LEELHFSVAGSYSSNDYHIDFLGVSIAAVCLIEYLRGCTMKLNKYIYAIIEVLLLAVIALLAFTVLNTEYLFGWAAHNWKFYLILGGIALLPLFLNKQIVSAFTATGIAVGIFIGNFLGRSIMIFNEGKIIKGMKTEDVHRLHHHPGFEIWIGVILLFISIGIIVQLILAKKRVNR
jgi:hypothetical protein